MIVKKIFFLILVFSLSSCGYEPIFLKQNDLNKLIKNLELSGDKNINRKIISFLSLKENLEKQTGYSLKLNSNKILEIVSKEKTGNTSIYRTTINVNVSLDDEDGKPIKQKEFSSNFTYNNMKNKFDLSEYQKNIDVNLLNKITEEIFIFLNS